MRVFYDRLVDDKDRMWLLSYLTSTIQNRFNAELDRIFKHLVQVSAGNHV